MATCHKCSQKRYQRLPVYCCNCWEALESEFGASDRAYNALQSELEAGKKAYDIQMGKQLGIHQSLKEDIAFTGKWSFDPGEPSPTSDATLSTSDGSKFHGHSLILANRSDVFRAMFEVDVREKRTGKVSVEDVKGESLKLFIKFLYTAQLSHEDMDANYRDLAKLAHLYQVKLLLQKLDMFVFEHVLTKEIATKVLKMAYMCELDRSKEATQMMIADDSDMFNMSMKELEGHPWIVMDFFKCIVQRLKGRSRVKAERP